MSTFSVCPSLYYSSTLLSKDLLYREEVLDVHQLLNHVQKLFGKASVWAGWKKCRAVMKNGRRRRRGFRAEGWVFFGFGWPVLLWERPLCTCTEVKPNHKLRVSSGQLRRKHTQASSVHVGYGQNFGHRPSKPCHEDIAWMILTADFLYSCKYYNPKTNIRSSDLLNSPITAVHCQEMLFPVQILNDRFYGVWYWVGKTTCKDPFYL